MFIDADLRTAATRLAAAADRLESAGVEARFDIADTGLAMIAIGVGAAGAPSEVVPMAHIFIHAKDDLAAAVERLIRKAESGRTQVAA